MRNSTVALITKSAFVLFNTSLSLLLICCLQHKWHIVIVHVSVGHVQTSCCYIAYIHLSTAPLLILAVASLGVTLGCHSCLVLFLFPSTDH